MEQRALRIPTARDMRLIDDYCRRSLDAQREWLDAVQEELEPTVGREDRRRRPRAAVEEVSIGAGVSTLVVGSRAG